MSRKRSRLDELSRMLMGPPAGGPGPVIHQADRAPDEVEPRTAYRSWTAHASNAGNGVVDWTLHAISHGCEWPPGERNAAICLSHDHADPPVALCCGFYAKNTPTEFFEDFNLAVDTSPGSYDKPRLAIFGEVKLWGRILEAERGIQAQYAYPSRLYLAVPDRPSDWYARNMMDVCRSLERRYHVPCTPHTVPELHALYDYDKRSSGTTWLGGNPFRYIAAPQSISFDSTQHNTHMWTPSAWNASTVKQPGQLVHIPQGVQLPSQTAWTIGLLATSSDTGPWPAS